MEMRPCGSFSELEFSGPTPNSAQCHIATSWNIPGSHARLLRGLAKIHTREIIGPRALRVKRRHQHQRMQRMSLTHLTHEDPQLECRNPHTWQANPQTGLQGDRSQQVCWNDALRPDYYIPSVSVLFVFAAACASRYLRHR